MLKAKEKLHTTKKNSITVDFVKQCITEKGVNGFPLNNLSEIQIFEYLDKIFEDVEAFANKYNADFRYGMGRWCYTKLELIEKDYYIFKTWVNRCSTYSPSPGMERLNYETNITCYDDIDRLYEVKKAEHTFSKIIGKTIKDVEGCFKNSTQIKITFIDNSQITISRWDEDEDTTVEDIYGDLNKIIGKKIIEANVKWDIFAAPYYDDYKKHYTIDANSDYERFYFYFIKVFDEDVTFRFFSDGNEYYSCPMSVNFFDEKGNKVQDFEEHLAFQKRHECVIK